MLFEVQDNIAELFQTDRATELDREALNLILLGCTEGSHRLSGSRSCLNKLARISGLSARGKRCIEMALARFSEEARLPHKLSTVGQIKDTPGLFPTVNFSGQQRIITFPLRWFDRTSRIQPVTLLGENLSDARVLGLIGQAGTVLTGLGYLPLSANYDGGGGSTTGLTLAHLADQGTLCVCVVDSDKKSPGSPIGSTATAVAKFKDHGVFPTLSVTETYGRDLENLLPDSFYSAKYGGHVLYGPFAKLLSELSATGETTIRAYVDVEKGIKLHDCRSELAGAQDPKFWKEKETTLLSMTGATPLCSSADVCPNHSRRDCVCQMSLGITANVLDDFFEHAAEFSRFKLASELDPSVEPEWRRLGANIASWCCGDARVRV